MGKVITPVIGVLWCEHCEIEEIVPLWDPLSAFSAESPMIAPRCPRCRKIFTFVPTVIGEKLISKYGVQ